MINPPIISFNTDWLERPTTAYLAGTPDWHTAAFELRRSHRAQERIVESCIRGFGCGKRAIAIEKAAGELVERYAASDPRVLKILGTEELQGQELMFKTLHPANKPLAPKKWICAKGLESGQCYSIPAVLAVLWGDEAQDADYGIDVDATGLAAGNSVQAATEHGIMEAIERDAVGLWWRSPRIHHHLIHPSSEIVYTARSVGLEITTAVIEIDTCYPVAVACISRVDGSEATVGSACRRERSQAVEHAIAEAFMVRPTALACSSNLEFEFEVPGSERLKWGWQNGEKLLSRFHSAASKSATDCRLVGNLDQLSQVFGHEPLVVNLATVVSNKSTKHVVRVLIPGSYRLESRPSTTVHTCARLLEKGGVPGGMHPFG
jgi:ribosomal protein S12 methylthiotransferase accessory factor YcaO